MIEVYKIMHFMEIADREKCSTLSHNSGIQGYLVKLKVGKFRTDKKDFLKLRNSLPQQVAVATNLDGFGVDKFTEISPSHPRSFQICKQDIRS